MGAVAIVICGSVFTREVLINHHARGLQQGSSERLVIGCQAGIENRNPDVFAVELIGRSHETQNRPALLCADEVGSGRSGNVTERLH